ncbi:hypothetical protein ACFWM7_01490 [Streptomyces sp. NPDC058375]|uniref:hypothetical protein n=1 Tax=Streptomyces sp. NPDC058375 TaxID=3346467 RepID=UPI00364DB134
MKQRIEFKGFVDVYTDEPLTQEEARKYVGDALLLGDKHADMYCAFMDDVTFFSSVGDDE